MNGPSSQDSRGRLKSFAMLAGLFLLFAMVAVWVFPGRKPPAEPSGPEPAPRYEARSGIYQVRPPSVAGQFYPDDPAELYRVIEQMMTNAPPVGLRGRRAILVPHAGYAFSGEVAATSFREVDPALRRVFILAANHNGEADFSGVSIPNVSHYAIPGAEIPLAAVVDDLLQDSLFTQEPEAHTMHMIELELPFLRYLQGQSAEVNFSIVPMIAGRLDSPQISRLAEILARYADNKTLFVFSADLSHYYPDAQARQLDQFSIQSILSRDSNSLARAVTDGNQILLTLIRLAELRGWEPDFLAYRNSGDLTGDRDRVVGYASVVFGDPLSLAEDERREMLRYARRVVEAYVRNGETPEPDPEWLARHPILRVPRGVFVTLKKEGQLRGCIGDIISNAPLCQGIQKCAIQAATNDPRFRPVTPEELPELAFSISILNFPTKVEVAEPEAYLKVLRPGKDGVILVFQGRRSTFLPSVWEELPDPREFLSRLCLKQGSPADSWRDPATALFRYGAYEVRESSPAPSR